MRILLLFILFLSVISCNNDNLIENTSENSTIELKTNTPSFISQIQVDYEGIILKTNNENIVSYGMLIGENENLTITSNQGNQNKEYTNGDTVYKGSFFDLAGNKKYFLRFYVKTVNKIYYGNTIAFETKAHTKPTEIYIKLLNQQQVEDFAQHNYTYAHNLEIGGSVKDLSPLSSLIKIGGDLLIMNTSQLENLHGLENIKLVGTDTFPNGRVQISNNSKLQTLSGLDNLIFSGRLYVGDNPYVQNLQGLGKLEQVWHSTYLMVPSFDGLPINFRTGEFSSTGFQGIDLGNRTINCEAYSFTLKDAPNITSLKGFIVGNYQNTTAFTIENCKSLKSLEGIVFPSVYDRINIINCENFESFKGIENLTNTEDLVLVDLPNLKKLHFLENVTKIQRFVVSNVGITDFMGLNNVKLIESFTIRFCNKLINFNGLSSLKKIGNSIQYFEVSNCSNLQNFVGLEQVEHFTRFNMNSLASLSSFTGIGTTNMPYISISQCNSITSLHGLENVSSNNVALIDNKNLQNYCAIKNIMTNINPNSFYLWGNLVNPTQQEIINSCP